MRRAFHCVAFLCLIPAIGLASKTVVQPIQLLKKSYSKTVEVELIPEQPYPIFLETNRSYYLVLRDQHDYIAKLPKSAVEPFIAEDSERTLFLKEPFLFNDDRAYLVFTTDEQYPVVSSSETGYRIRYQLEDTQIEVGVDKKEFLPPNQLLKDPKAAVCMIQYENGGGSGFLLQMNDGLYCITNQHVIANTGTPEIRLINGRRLTTGDYEFALDRDMARIRILDELPAFIKMGEPDLNQKITVLGNSYARGRVTILSGEVTGLNELEIETTAKFVPGNSGSPIVSKENEVIGVATAIDHYAKNDSFVEGTVFEGGRRIGLRVDDSIEWIPVNMDLFSSRNRNLFQIKTFVDELPYAYRKFAQTEVEQSILSTDFLDRSLKEWVKFRNMRFADCIDAFDNAKAAGYAQDPDRYDYSAQARIDREAYQDNLKKEASACWTAMRQKLQSKRRSLQSYQPYPDTAFMREHIDQMKHVIDTALDATIRIQKGLVEAR